MKFIIPVVLLTATAMQIFAADVISSVDKDGSVTFSDTPVPGNADSAPIAIEAPAPASDTLSESQREAQAVIDKANCLQQQEAATQVDKAEADASALQELDRANAELEAAKVIGEGDRQSLAGGGSKLTQEYQDRVQTAEKKVEAAQEQLKQAD